MSLDVRYNRYLGTSPAKGLLWICLLAWPITGSHAMIDVNCCSDGSTWLKSMNCSDGMKVNLRCPHGSYLIDPDASATDNFTVVPEFDNVWLEFKEFGYERIPGGGFCVADRRNGSRIALVCFENEDDTSPSIWKEKLFSSLSIISAVFLIATLAVYVLLPELREVQDKAMMAVVTSLAVSYIILSIQNLRLQEDGDLPICISLGFLLYFGFISVFFWLNIVSFNVWRTVWFKSFPVRDKPLFVIYCLWGWGAPMCFLMLALVTHHIRGHHLRPGFGEKNCWFKGSKQMWAYFYGPIGILLTLNIVYLGLTSWRLWHQYRDYSGSKLRALRFKCLLYVKLILVMGVTWIFEVLSYADGSKNNFWIPTDILNALQGLVIFLLLVATRKRVRKLLAKKRPCGIAFPKSWAAYEDEECEEVLPEEIELSQQG